MCLTVMPREPGPETDFPASSPFLIFLLLYSDRRYHFRFMLLSKHSAWCKAIMQSVDDTDDAKKAESEDLLHWRLGTVVAFNPHRRYFSVFQPAVEEKVHAEDNSAEDFLGVGEPDWQAGLGTRSAEEVAVERIAMDMRSRLSLWMDRHNDGAIARLRVSKWPAL